MNNIETITALLQIQMIVYCPNCNHLIDLLNPIDTDDVNHNDDSDLLKQMFPDDGDRSSFNCENVTCTSCKTTFNVEGLEW